MESIFTAVYRAYEDRRSREEVCLSLDDEPLLFATEIRVEEDEKCCMSVIETLCRRFGEENYYDLCLTLASPDPEKAQAVYGTIASGLGRGCAKGHLFDPLADADVNRAFKLARSAGRENNHYQGFTRFEELDQGIMYACIRPKNNLLPFLMDHFADRFPEENFVVHDSGRHLLGVHPAKSMGAYPNGSMGTHSDGGMRVHPAKSMGVYPAESMGADWLVLGEDAPVTQKLKYSSGEEKYRMLFKEFCQSITIRERENPGLQKQMLPLRFREYMTEFL